MEKVDKKFISVLVESAETYKKNLFLYLRVLLPVLAPLFLLNYYVWGNYSVLSKMIGVMPHFVFKALKYSYQIGSIFLVLFVWVAFIKTVEASDKKVRIAAYKEAAKAFFPYLKVKWLYLAKVLLWTCALIVPGFICLIMYSLSSMANLIDGKKGREALEASKKIIKKYYNRYLDYLLFVCFVIFGFSFPAASILHNVGNLFFGKRMYLVSDLLYFSKLLVYLLAAIFFFVFYYYLYKELSSKFELYS